ncbi:NAD(P)/FAD-dependent oxidoreductase [Streptomyces sp. 6N223]|uniref:NAD(P)/FAD-dependent oxidoreductase n=1 Tax=Streptomyces sp. 6N223 TaxID=3457412 RepID=UPI003FD5C133
MTTDVAPDVVVVGAGVIGAATACFAARAGLRVVVLDRGPVAGGTSGRGEGNLLVSDKEAGPELDLALLSRRVWREELGEHGALWEYEDKGGLIVAATEASAAELAELTRRQRAAGVNAVDLAGPELAAYEPHLAPGLAAGAYYPQDAQLQPMLAVAHLLRLARESGNAEIRTGGGAEVTGFLHGRGGRITGVRTAGAGALHAGRVVNAAGPWAGSLAGLAGVRLPVEPRRGFVLVTEPLPPGTVRHKVYAAEYAGDVASPDAGLASSPVVESTASGTVLIGSTRERVGFDATLSLAALRALAAGAVGLFPALAGVRAMRAYAGFRPYSPDHLPVIGPDPRAPGLWHAGGHEGAGIGLGAGTGWLLAQALAGGEPELDLGPFAPERFEREERF